MENAITGILYRKMLMLDKLDGERDVCHDLFQNFSNYRYLLIGPPTCGRTSLLFEFAFQTAEISLNDNFSSNNISNSESSYNNVLYIAPRRIEKLPNLVGNRKTAPCSNKLKNIHIYYPLNFEECMDLLSNIRSKEDVSYQMVIVDDFDLYLEDSKKELTQKTAALSAMLVDTVAYFSQKTGRNVMLLCSIDVNKRVARCMRDVLEIYFRNDVLLYPHHSRNGFSIKSETRAFSLLSEKDDVDLKTIHAIYNGDNKIDLTS